MPANQTPEITQKTTTKHHTNKRQKTRTNKGFQRNKIFQKSNIIFQMFGFFLLLVCCYLVTRSVIFLLLVPEL